VIVDGWESSKVLGKRRLKEVSLLCEALAKAGSIGDGDSSIAWEGCQ
jgi:hypothetical protein